MFIIFFFLKTISAQILKSYQFFLFFLRIQHERQYLFLEIRYSRHYAVVCLRAVNVCINLMRFDR